MRGSREISLVPSLHRASTDALIRGPEPVATVDRISYCARVGKRSCASEGAEYTHAIFYYAHAFYNKRAYFRSARTHTNVITTRNSILCNSQCHKYFPVIPS